MANDLCNIVPSPLSEAELVRPPSPEIVKGVPAGAESGTDSSVIDSGDEWDKTEVGVCGSIAPLRHGKDRSHLGMELHAATQEEEMIQKQDSTWEDIVNRQSSGDAEEEDWGVEENSQSAWQSPSLEMPP